MDEKEMIDMLLLLRNAYQEDAEYHREEISRREALFCALVDKYIKRIDADAEKRLQDTFQDDPRRARGR